MPVLLFIYGTLHPDRAPREIAASARKLVPVGRATIRGHRYDLGEFPGVVLDDSAAPVAGELFRVPDHPTLAALDAYEDFREHDPANSLFLRSKAVATLEDGSKQSCWVYTWNGTRHASPEKELPEEDPWNSKRGDCCSGE